MKQDYSTRLYDKMYAEYERLQTVLEDMVPQEIAGYVYELAIKQELLSCCRRGCISQDRAKALCRLKEPLQELYRACRRDGLGFSDAVERCAGSRADAAIRENRSKTGRESR